MIHWLDLTLLITVLLNIVVGVIRGAIREVFSVAAIAVGLFLGYRFHHVLAVYLPGVSPLIARVICFVVLFVLISLGVGWCGGLIGSSLKRTGAKTMDRWAGAVLGGMRGFVMIALLLWGIQTLMPDGENIIRKSRLGPIGLTWTQTAIQFYHQATGGHPQAA